MIYDLQKGSLLKRASAFLLDAILLAILAVGFACLLSLTFGFDSYSDTYSQALEKYSSDYNVSFDITQATYMAFSDAERETWDAAYNALISDSSAMKAYSVMSSMTIAITSVSILLAYAIIEFVFPKIFGNGQSIGKKIFGLAVMRTNGVAISSVALFIRTFLGKYVIETMIPVLIITMVIFNTIGIIGPVIIFLILVLQVIMVAVTRTNSMIHDLLSDCVVVDMASQMIFSSEEEMVAYKAKVAAENAASSEY